MFLEATYFGDLTRGRVVTELWDLNGLVMSRGVQSALGPVTFDELRVVPPDMAAWTHFHALLEARGFYGYDVVPSESRLFRGGDAVYGGPFRDINLVYGTPLHLLQPPFLFVGGLDGL